MKNFILMFIIFLPFHSFSQTQVVLESGKIINDKVNSFLNGKLIFDEIEYVANFPLSGKDFSYIRKNYRYTKVESHLIFYKYFINKEIEVVRILHKNMEIVQVFR